MPDNHAIHDESKRIDQKPFDIKLVEIFLGHMRGSKDERSELERLKQDLGERIYPEIIYTLVHQRVDNTAEARELLKGIVHHKEKLDGLLGRDIGIQVAALDYARNVEKILRNPTVIEEEKIAELARLAVQDEFARAYDKGALLNDLKKEVERTKRYGLHFAVVFIDVDNLRTINDTYGPPAGDFALERLSELLKSNVRAVDSVYRFGGDEFVLLLPNAEREIARKVAEKLLTRIRETRINYDVKRGISFPMTVSIGVESFDDQTVQNVEGVLNTVDTLLDEAKRSGKNRIEIAEREGPEKTAFAVLAKTAGAVPPGQRLVIKGIPISSGAALGKAFIYKDILNELEYYEVQEEELEKELERMRNAVRHVRADVERMEKQVRRNLGKEYADIFMVHRTILDDMTLINEMEEKLKLEKRNAEHIIRNVFKHFENRLVTSEDRLMRERSFDIADLSRRLLQYLAGINRNIFGKLPKNSIVVAKRLLPSESVHLRRGNIRAIVTEKGSRNSHAGILARGLGIPYVSETECPIDLIRHGGSLIVNADTGEIIVNPSAEDKENVRSAMEIQRQENLEMIKRFKDVRLAKEERLIRVMANVGTKNSIAEAIRVGCDGIGLSRIEQIYMQSRIFPTQEQLFRVLDELFEDVGDKEINVRLLDIGGDKTLPYFDMKGDMYSVLGVRGVRFLLRYPKILETQLAVFLKLSHKYRIRILIPMVTLPHEVATVRHYLEKAKQGLRRSGIPFNENILLGSMIEIPAAVVKIKDMLSYSDFISIGTNDLVQYTMASARENTALSKYYEAGTEIVLKHIEYVIDQARNKNIDCSICGELAADTNYTEKLLNMGLDTFSVSPANILKVKSRISDIIGIERYIPAG